MVQPNNDVKGITMNVMIFLIFQESTVILPIFTAIFSQP